MIQVQKLRIQDGILALLFGALIWLAHDLQEQVIIAILAALLLADRKTEALSTLQGRIAITSLQLVALFCLFWITDGVNTLYYLLLLVPIVSAATYLGVIGTVVSSVLAIGTYLCYLLFIDWNQWFIETEQMHVLAVRGILLAVAAVLVNYLGEAIRLESARHKAAAEQLADANRHLRDAEAAVRRSERLAALGQLSAGLAHELRNPLGSIRGSAELLTRATAKDNEVARELAQIISEEVDRTNSLVTRFLDFARPLEPRRETTDITRAIDRAAKHARLEIIRNFSPEVPALEIDPALMEQVLLNLLSNAQQASADGAPITVSTRLVGDQAEIAIVDHGCGIPADKLDSIFNPFVTTKQTGVGLGLAIVAKIVDGHGGKIAVESEVGKGSTFRVLLPLPVPAALP